MKLARSVLVQQGRIGIVHDDTVVAKPLLTKDHVVRCDGSRVEACRLQPAVVACLSNRSGVGMAWECY